MRAYRRHLRTLGYCAAGSREWFSRHGLSWTAFLAEGIETAELRQTGDAMALRLAELAEAEEAANG